MTETQLDEALAKANEELRQARAEMQVAAMDAFTEWWNTQEAQRPGSDGRDFSARRQKVRRGQQRPMAKMEPIKELTVVHVPVSGSRPNKVHNKKRADSASARGASRSSNQAAPPQVIADRLAFEAAANAAADAPPLPPERIGGLTPEQEAAPTAWGIQPPAGGWPAAEPAAAQAGESGRAGTRDLASSASGSASRS